MAGYRAAHPDGYSYTWFCEHFAAFEAPDERDDTRYAAGAVMRTDYAGRAVAGDRSGDPASLPAQIFHCCAGRLNLTFAFASSSRKLPDWIEARCERSPSSAASPSSHGHDNPEGRGVVKALWFEPTLNATFAAMAEHYDTTILPARGPQKPRQGLKVEGRGADLAGFWRLRNRSFFSIAKPARRSPNCSRAEQPMRHLS